MIKLLYSKYQKKLEEYYLNDIRKIADHSRILPIITWLENNNYGEQKRYQDWLFDNSIMLARENKQFYLQFFKEEDAILFALRWS